MNVSKAKNPDRQRALVLVVRKGAVPAMLLCDALLCGVARLPPKGWHRARFKFDVVNCVAVSRHTRWFKNIRVFGYN